MDDKALNITIHTLWTCDAWIATKSFSLIGIFSTKEKAIDVARDKQLLQKDTYVVIYSGELDNYDDTEQNVSINPNIHQYFN